MKTEISAGGVVVRKSRDKWQVLLLKDMNGNWTFPKGLVENGEEPEQAAIREIAEEVGLVGVAHLANLSKIHYFYNRGGLISKDVHYFLFEVKDNPKLKPQTEEGITQVKWLSLEEAEKIIGYPKTNLSLLQQTLIKLKRPHDLDQSNKL